MAAVDMRGCRYLYILGLHITGVTTIHHEHGTALQQ
jgi:hypothetical protein